MRMHRRLIEKLRRHPTGKCPKCEHDTRLDHRYCEVCGYEIVEQAKADVARIKPI